MFCAINGTASHLVTYDEDLLSLRSAYLSEFSICRPIDFLADLRR
jgi:predicted nucleic acid-binding protein